MKDQIRKATRVICPEGRKPKNILERRLTNVLEALTKVEGQSRRARPKTNFRKKSRGRRIKATKRGWTPLRNKHLTQKGTDGGKIHRKSGSRGDGERREECKPSKRRTGVPGMEAEHTRKGKRLPQRKARQKTATQ